MASPAIITTKKITYKKDGTIIMQNEVQKNIEAEKQQALDRVRKGWQQACSSVFKTGVFGGKVADGSTNREEKTEVLMIPDRSYSIALRTQACIMAESLGKAPAEGMVPAINLSGDERMALELGLLPLSVIKSLRNVVTVIRDATNTYIQVTYYNMVKLAGIIDREITSLLHKKWTLEELVKNCGDLDTIRSIDWNTSYSDIDGGGE